MDVYNALLSERDFRVSAYAFRQQPTRFGMVSCDVVIKSSPPWNTAHRVDAVSYIVSYQFNGHAGAGTFLRTRVYEARCWAAVSVESNADQEQAKAIRDGRRKAICCMSLRCDYERSAKSRVAWR
eukprot:3036369-Pleurochrysis_carterae.AAC.3